MNWFGTILAFTVLTILATYLIPSDSVIVAVRYIFAFIFLSFVPGYCLVNILFVGKNKLDFVEQLVLSIALSFGIAGLVGLFLGLSPIGISFSSITISMSIVVLVFAVFAFGRKIREISGSDMQTPKKISS